MVSMGFLWRKKRVLWWKSIVFGCWVQTFTRGVLKMIDLRDALLEGFYEFKISFLWKDPFLRKIMAIGASFLYFGRINIKYENVDIW